MHKANIQNKENENKEIIDNKDEKRARMGEKKWVWIPDSEKTFIKGFILEEKDNKVLVEDVHGKQHKISNTKIQKMNPEKFDMIEDLAGLSHLNEASVLHNLTKRYKRDLIYTYSGLFLLVMNPYKNLKIYNEAEMIKYSKLKKYELPPHIFAVANYAYHSMLVNKENQSILITGESGAGKTENTKKVINYLTYIAGQRSESIKSEIETQIINTNPILEAFGNAKTIYNDNSSRFGKFIKVQFDRGFITGASIEKYLLEKSRVTKQPPNEQNYHIFYQLLSGADKVLKKVLMIKNNNFRIVKNYEYRKEDAEKFQNLIACMKSLKFADRDITSILQIVSSILHMGNIKFTEVDDQAQIENLEEVEVVCKLLSIPVTDFLKCILHPLSKAGNDVIISRRNKKQASNVIEALCSIMYEKLFEKVVSLINKTIFKPIKGNFIGILDIAGFEIFKENDFEQFCINYTNEKLQQFFNHHMFILEQEIYKKESIEWNYIDFGQDLQPTIDLIEKNNPIGIFAYLDEECVMPCASDKTFFEKLKSGIKSDKFQASKFHNQFQLDHYAGKVNYNVENWIEKNKEPYFENLCKFLSTSGNKFVSSMFKVYEEKNSKKGYFRTLAQKHKEQLAVLMKNLEITNPHFVRCILPNKNKSNEEIENELILSQLRCNGVLEGIRISRLGFPTRITFSKFINRYEFLSSVINKNLDEVDQVKSILKEIPLNCSQYRIGRSKVFFKQGVLADIEELREDKASQLAIELQSFIRKKLTIRKYYLYDLRKKAQSVLVKNFIALKNLQRFPWWRLYIKIKPLLDVAKVEEEKKEQIAKINKYEEDLRQAENEKQELKNKISEMELQHDKDRKENEMASMIISQKDELLNGMRTEKCKLETAIEDLNRDKENFKSKISELKSEIQQKVEEFNKAKDSFQSENKQQKLQIENFQNELHDQRKKLKTISDEKEYLNSEIKLLKAKENDLQQQLLSRCNEDQSMKKLINDKDEEINKIQTENEELRKMNDKFKNEIESKNQLFTLFKEQTDNKFTKLKERLKDINIESSQTFNQDFLQIKNLIEKSKNESKKLRTLNSKYLKQIEELNELIERKEKEKEDLNLECDSYQNKIMNYEKDIRTQNIEIGKIKENLKIKSLNVENLEKKIVELQNKNEEYEETIRKVENIEKSASTKYDSLLSKIKHLEKSNKKLNMMYKEEKQYANQLKEELENLHAENLSVMQKKLDEIFKKESEMNSERKSLQMQIKTLESENERLKLALTEKTNNEESSNSNEGIYMALEDERKKNVELRRSLVSQENKNLELLNTIEKMKQEFNYEIEEKVNEINDLLNKISTQGSVKNSIKDIKSDMSGIQNEIKTLKSFYQQLFLEKIGFYKNLVVKSENDLKDLKNEYNKKFEELESQLDDKKSEIQILSKQNEELEMKLEKISVESSHQIEYQINLTKHLQNKNEVLENKITLFELKNGTQENHLTIKNLMKAESDEFSEKITKFENEIKNLRNECKELRQYKQKYETRNSLFEIEKIRNSDLQQEVNNLKNDIQNLKTLYNKTKEAVLNLESQNNEYKSEIQILNKQMEIKDDCLKFQKSEKEIINQQLISLKKSTEEFETKINEIKIPETIQFTKIEIPELKFDERLKLKIESEQKQNEEQKEIIKALRREILDLKKVNNQYYNSIKQMERDLKDHEGLIEFYKALLGKN